MITVNLTIIMATAAVATTSVIFKVNKYTWTVSLGVHHYNVDMLPLHLMYMCVIHFDLLVRRFIYMCLTPTVLYTSYI